MLSEPLYETLFYEITFQCKNYKYTPSLSTSVYRREPDEKNEISQEHIRNWEQQEIIPVLEVRAFYETLCYWCDCSFISNGKLYGIYPNREHRLCSQAIPNAEPKLDLSLQTRSAIRYVLSLPCFYVQPIKVSCLLPHFAVLWKKTVLPEVKGCLYHLNCLL